LAEAYIYECVRTPRGKGRANGSLHTLSPVELSAAVLKALDERTGFSKAEPEDVIFGIGDGVNDQGSDLARSALLYAGMPETIPGSTVSRFCSSGLDAVNAAASRVMSGQGDLFVAGGIEMMSLIPIGGTGGPNGSDALFNDRVNMIQQGISADLMATLYGHSREHVDAFAVESQRRAGQAWREGRFARSVVPVRDADGELLLDRDEYMRPDTSMEALAQLPPAFKGMGEQGGFDAIAKRRYPEVLAIEHVHTAGNSSGIVDGAAAILIGSRAAGKRLGLQPRAVIRSFANAAMDPSLMLAAPADATESALKRVGKRADEADLYEVNEAFATVVLRFMERTGVPHDKVNVNGGSIAMGHPIGATGVMLTGTLIDELERTGKDSGVVTLCVGLGMAVATYIERVS
jgi:acetyl-CoA C-acetyltransferase